MARPQKWRKVEFIPVIQRFGPLDLQSNKTEENILRIEEVESIRLKDIEKLEQEECAEKMEVSRQTFQRILNTAREKIADSIINGKGIRIEGGNFTRNICAVHCLDCSKEWKESYENFERIINGQFTCPECNSKRIACQGSKGQIFCKRNCWKRGNKEPLE